MTPLVSFLFAALCVLGEGGAEASGLLVPKAPGPPLERGWVLESQVLRATVHGEVALVTVEQVFENRQPRTLDADFVFVFAPGVRPRSTALIVGGDTLQGRLLQGQAAREAWTGVLRRRKDTALIEFLGRDLYVAPGLSLPPGAKQTVIFKYEQPVISRGGDVELRLPLRAAGVSLTSETTMDVRIDIELGRSQTRGDSRRGFDSRADTDDRVEIGPVYSPTHDVSVERAHARHVAIRYTGLLGDREPDLRVFWTTTRSAVGATMLTYWPQDEERGYFLLAVQPSRFESARLENRPRDVTFVVDISQSMVGDRLAQIRAALERAIGALDLADRLNVVAFGDAAKKLWNAPRFLDASNRRRALAFVRNLVAEGGSNVDAALATALAAPREEDRSAVLVFVTDGRPTRGEASRTGILDHVRASNESQPARIHTLGIGVDVDTVLVDRLALESGGLPMYVRPHEDAGDALLGLLAATEQAVLAGLALELGGVGASDVLPKNLPDLVRGGALFVTGRYGQAGRPEIVLGERVGAVRQEYGSLLWAAGRGDVSLGPFPARVWASRRIAAHVDALRLGTEIAPDRVKELVALSTRFGILTEYTAFLADELADHTAVASSVALTARKIGDFRAQATGALGLSQALNQSARRSVLRAPLRAQAGWLPGEGGRDVTRVTWAGVRQVGGRSYFDRRGLGWVDAGVGDLATASERIARWTPRFFQLLESSSWAENAALALVGPVVLRVGGRAVQIVD